MEEFMTFMAPYWTSVGTFIIVYGTFGFFEELLGIRGVTKFLSAVIIAVLFYHFWDDVAFKFASWLEFLGLVPVSKQ